jgi:hypothetical protein
MNFVSNNAAVHEMFQKENDSRIRFSRKIHEKEDPREDFYNEKPK